MNRFLTASRVHTYGTRSTGGGVSALETRGVLRDRIFCEDEISSIVFVTRNFQENHPCGATTRLTATPIELTRSVYGPID